MNLTEQTNDTVEQAMRLLSPVDMSDYAPPAHLPIEEQTRAEQAEYERRDHARVDAYLADRQDRLACLKTIRAAALVRADMYEDKAGPWLRLQARAKRMAAYAETLARNVLEAERQIAGFDADQPYTVTQPDGTKIGLKLNPESVKVDDPKAVPAELYEDPKPLGPSLSKIAAALRAGRVVPGARFVRGQSLRWK